MTKRLLTDEELEWLAECYLRLTANKAYQKYSKLFKDYIDEFLEAELLALKKPGGLNG